MPWKANICREARIYAFEGDCVLLKGKCALWKANLYSMRWICVVKDRYVPRRRLFMM